MTFCSVAFSQTPWITFAKGAHHDAGSSTASQSLNRIHWQTPVDLHPVYSGGELLIHYGSPLITASNTVVVPVKTGESGGFRVEAHAGANGNLIWSAPTDYALPPSHGWTPIFGPALAAAHRLYFPGAGGTLIYRENPDSATGTIGRIAFYGLASYKANPTGFNSTVFINTPLTTDAQGNVYFGFLVSGISPLSTLKSGIARISATGQATWVGVGTASGDSSMSEVPYNCAPALSVDHKTLYAGVSNASVGYLVAVDSTTLAPIASVRLKDPKSGLDATLTDDASTTPTTGPDGDVYYGVLEDPFGENHDRGWLLHFNADLSQEKTPGAFGWDDTASMVPAAIVASYTGTSEYLLMTKYNNYIEVGGDGENKIAILDPNATETDPISGITVMKEVITMVGQTPDPDGGVKEWCINNAVVDIRGKAVLANSEDGKQYRWDLTTNTLSQSIVLTPGLGEAYTPTLIGVDGTVYAINNATLFAVGN